jgi:hypothetical protein
MTAVPTFDNSARIGSARISTRAQKRQAQLAALAAAQCRQIVIKTTTTRGDRRSCASCWANGAATGAGTCGSAIRACRPRPALSPSAWPASETGRFGSGRARYNGASATVSPASAPLFTRSQRRSRRSTLARGLAPD